MTYLLPGAINLIGQLPTRAGAAPYPLRSSDAIRSIVLHYVGGEGAHGYGDVSPQQTAAYQTGPTAQEQFPAIAYHVYIARDGTVYQCHDPLTRTWHAGKLANDEGIAICLAGYGILGYPSAVQILLAAGAVLDIQKWLGRPLAIRHHGEYTATDCCGKHRSEIVAEIAGEVKNATAKFNHEQIRGELDRLWAQGNDDIAAGEAQIARGHAIHAEVIAIKQKTGFSD
jgi:hypothetical protein